MVKNNVKEKDIEAQKIGTQIIHQELSKKIIEIADHFSGLSGIVPCASYTSVRMFREYINDNRFIWALESAQNLDAIKEFTERARAGESVFLVSAGISEGHSFDNDISRVQILTKYPYPARDSVMVDLCKRWGESYYGARTAMTLQQMAGRSMRSAEDWCVTIMLDKKFDVLKNPKLHQHYSKHFIKCLMWDQMWQLYEWPTDG
jgi:Rad3-related DNA helicase